MMNLALMASQQALVLMEKRISENGTASPLNPNDTEYVYLKGRKPGIIAKLLNLLGIDSTTEFIVYKDRIEFRTGSLFGKIHEIYPFESISNLGTGFVKPIALVAAAFTFLIISIPMFFQKAPAIYLGLLLLAIAVFLVVKYILSKTLLLYFMSNSGAAAVMLCKKAVIENTEFGEETAHQIMKIVEDRIKETHSGTRD